MPLENTGAEERITRETMIGWVEHWGESYDDVRPDDGAVRLANRIIEYNEMTETVEDLGSPDAVYDELASILQPVLSSMDGTCFAGSEWFAGEVDRMEADRISGGQPEETGGLVSEGPRIPFIVEAEATAADTGEPPLDELITAATREYLDSGMTYDGFSEHVRTTCATRQPTTGRSSWPSNAPQANGRPTRTGSPYWAWRCSSRPNQHA